MEFIIGRDANTSQLKISTPHGSKLFGVPSEVPMSVSRQHCKITLDSNLKYHITNIKMTNETFVNGLSVQTKQISETDKVELGSEHYQLNWSYIKEMLPKMADIRPLKAVWEEFDKHRTDQQIADRKFNTLRGATGLITMIAIALSIVLGHGPIYLFFYGVAFLIALGFTIKAYKDATAIPLKMKKLQDKFNHDYVCPHCGRRFTHAYDELIKMDSCPFCKAQFKK